MYDLIVDEDRYCNLIAGAAVLVRLPIEQQPEDGQYTPDNRYGMWCYYEVYRKFFWVSGGRGSLSATRTERTIDVPFRVGEIISIGADTSDEREQFLIWDIRVKKRSNMTSHESRLQGFHLPGPVGANVPFNARQANIRDNERQSWARYEETFGYDAWCFLIEVECIS